MERGRQEASPIFSSMMFHAFPFPLCVRVGESDSRDVLEIAEGSQCVKLEDEAELARQG